MVSWSTVGVLLFTSVVYGAFCVAVARAFLRARSDRTSYWTAGVWAAFFAVIVVGSLMAADAFGVDAAAAFSACVCVVSFPICLLLDRRWSTRAMAAAVAYVQLHRPAPVPAQAAALEPAPWTWEDGLESTCARLARAYDLTRREEDVLRLLMEGCTFAQAAERLVVSLNTVKSHVRHIYAKMGVSGKQDLLAKIQR